MNGRAAIVEDTGEQMVEEVRLHPERFEAILASISDGVFTVDANWRVTCFNRAAEAITGIPRGDAIGRHCSEVFRSDLCRGACPIRYTLETGVPVTGLVVYITTREGPLIPVSVSTALFCDAEGTVVGGVETFRDMRQIEQLRKQIEKSYESWDIVNKSPRMAELTNLLPTVADSQSTVLLTGETGTGKELFARAIHGLSNHRDGSFVALNCASFPETLVESELFGYEKGAFTGADRRKAGRFERAQYGTLFLDEIGDMPKPAQAKLLRVLQENAYEPLGGTEPVATNARVIAATNRDLAEMVERGDFRRDLYYRVRVIEISVPPLRERVEDILPLARRCIRELNCIQDKGIEGMTPEALRILLAHGFPGNVRELKNILEHGYVLSRGPLIGVEDLPAWLVKSSMGDASPPRLEDCEKRTILAALEQCDGNRLEAARLLGMHKSTLFRRIRRLGIRLPARNRKLRSA